jgi:hypothetical protein
VIEEAAREGPHALPIPDKSYRIGVGGVVYSPSLRTGQAVFPHTALQKAVSVADDFMGFQPAARVPVCQRMH